MQKGERKIRKEESAQTTRKTKIKKSYSEKREGTYVI